MAIHYISPSTTPKYQSFLCLQEAPIILEKVYWLAVGILNPIIDIFTQGLADFLCLDTLRHGTSWNKYLNIRVFGATPALGGISASQVLSESEKTASYVNNSKNFFFTFRDNVGYDFNGNIRDIFERFDAENQEGLGMGVIQDKPLSLGQKINQELFIHFCPRFYAMSAGWAEAADINDKSYSATTLKVINAGLSLFAPTVKFRFRREDLEPQFHDDPLMMGSALRTDKPISTEHLGLKGIFLQGCDGNITHRISQNPKKALWGLARLINPVGIMLLTLLGGYLAVQSIQKSIREARTV